MGEKSEGRDLLKGCDAVMCPRSDFQSWSLWKGVEKVAKKAIPIVLVVIAGLLWYYGYYYLANLPDVLERKLDVRDANLLDLLERKLDVQQKKQSGEMATGVSRAASVSILLDQPSGSGLGAFLKVFGQTVMETAAHVVTQFSKTGRSELCLRQIGAVVMEQSSNRTFTLNDLDLSESYVFSVWSPSKDVAWLALKSPVDVPSALELSPEPLFPGKRMFGGKVSRKGEYLSALCNLVQEDGDHVWTTNCPGAEDNSGMVYVDDEGRALLVHTSGELELEGRALEVLKGIPEGQLGAD
jgi:hypothetical protein